MELKLKGRVLEISEVKTLMKTETEPALNKQGQEMHYCDLFLGNPRLDSFGEESGVVDNYHVKFWGDKAKQVHSSVTVGSTVQIAGYLSSFKWDKKESNGTVKTGYNTGINGSAIKVEKL